MHIWYTLIVLNMAFENVLLVVILIGVVLFGAQKLPELARALGKAQSEFENGKESLFAKLLRKKTEVCQNKMN